MLKIAYDEKQNVEKVNSYSPSSRKPKLLMERIKSSGIRFEIIPVEPIEEWMFLMAHDNEFAKDVLHAKRPNGFGTICADVAKSLPYTSGSLMAAAKEALSTKTAVLSPTSGFHHAGYRSNGGFCSLNGLMVVATNLARLKLARRILILDFDAHYGDGTESIIRHLKIDYVTHITNGSGYSYHASTWLDFLKHNLEPLIASHDLILYQAGADPHINDPLGGYISTEEMLLRDQLVFSFAQKNEKPLAWNLAGGYQVDASGNIDKVLDLHMNTIRAYEEYYLPK